MTTINDDRGDVLAAMHERLRELECQVVTMQHAENPRSRADITLDAIARVLEDLEEDDDLGTVSLHLQRCVRQIELSRRTLQASGGKESLPAGDDEAWDAISERLRKRVEWLEVLAQDLHAQAFEAEQLAERWGAAVQPRKAS